MIKLRTTESAPIVIDMHMSSPSVYLDYGVIAKFANNSTLGNEFCQVLMNKNGTLCLSALHLIETFGLGTGPTYSRIKSFLASLGNRFIILDFDPGAVIARERNWKVGNPCPAFDLNLMKEIVHHWDGMSPFDFGVLLTGLERNPQVSEKWKKLQRDKKRELQELFQAARQEYRRNAQVQKNITTTKCPDSLMAGKTEYLYCELRRECIKTNEDFIPTDGPDFFHAVVSTSYADFVVLDKKWARRVRSIQMPMKSAKVFSTIEPDSFLHALRDYDGGQPATQPERMSVGEC